jgi:hypothetical protein
VIESLLRLHGAGRRITVDDGRATQDGVLETVSRRGLVASTTDPGEVGLRPVDVGVRGERAMLHLSTRAVASAKGRLELAFPEELALVDGRSSPRSRLRPYEATVVLEPHAPEPIARPIVEVGAGGFSFELHPGGRTPVPEGAAAEVAVAWSDGEILAMATIRRIGSNEEGRTVCAVEIVAFGTPADEERWHRFVLRVAHPSVSVDGCSRIEASWSLLESSDYVSRWALGDRQRLSAAYRRAWSTEVDGRILVAAAGDRPAGTAAASRIYPTTWLLHHLAFAREARSLESLRSFLAGTRALSCACAYAIRHLTPAKHFMVLAEDGTRWNHLLYHAFREVAGPRRSLLSTLAVHEHRLEPAPSAPEIAVHRATPPEARAIARRLVELLPALEVDALAYAPSDIALEGMGSRTRTLLVAGREADPSAVAIVETGPEGANLFGLYDTSRIINLSARPIPDRVSRSLLTAAVDHHRAHGSRKLVHLEDGVDHDAALAATGFQFVARGIRWIGDRDVLSRWSSYIDSILQTSSVFALGVR